MPTRNSIYPEYFAAELAKLDEESGSELVNLFTALEHFQRDIKEAKSQEEIFRVTQAYIEGLGFFIETIFYQVDPNTFEFQVALAHPPEASERMKDLVKQQIKTGKFAWALRQRGPTLFVPRVGDRTKGMFHVLGDASHIVGMFCGLIDPEVTSSPEIRTRLLTILLNTAAYALSEAKNLAELEHKILATNSDLQRTLQENKVLARLPAESPEPMIRAGKNGKVLYSNLAGLGILKAMGFAVGDMLGGEWLVKIEQAFQAREKNEFEAAFDGRAYVFLVVPVEDAGYVNFYGKDITARKQAEAELVKAREAALGASRAKSQFLANMSHEIRTPLNAILGFADVLNRQTQDPKSKNFLSAISSSGKTLLTLINDILDLSKVEAGKLEIRYEPMCPRRLFEEIQQIFLPAADSKKVELRYEADLGLPDEILLDEVRLRQILLNTVGNALKFTSKGWVVIRSWAEQANAQAIILYIEISDSGIGIPESEQQKIFETFTQAAGHDTKKYGGTGLGLAITKRLTEMMKGTITVRSRVGKGTTFLFQFKDVMVTRTQSQTSGTPSIAHVSEHAPREGCRGERIPELLVALKAEELDVLPTLQQTLAIRKISQFAERMIRHGLEFQVEDLKIFGKRLLEQTTAFDLRKIPQTLSEFPFLVQELERQKVRS
ncbi:MAG: ATP-binding protein [Verrucomicrobiota bacterium]|nr:ATP-binding protein [Verrucomicrobiota bacterium]